VVATIPVGSEPLGVAFTPDGTQAYVANIGSNTVSVIATATNTVVAEVTVIEPAAVAVSPNGQDVYVAKAIYTNAKVRVIATATNRKGPRSRWGMYPRGWPLGHDAFSLHSTSVMASTL
jgi:YVTN family beta-propeller protein